MIIPTVKRLYKNSKKSPLYPASTFEADNMAFTVSRIRVDLML